jgi:hypothetical protein
VLCEAVARRLEKGEALAILRFYPDTIERAAAD